VAMKRSALLAWVLGIFLVGALAGIVSLVRSGALQTAEIDRLARENEELRAQTEALRGLPAAESPALEPAAPAASRPPEARPAPPDQAALLERLKNDLAEANSALAQFEIRLEEQRLEAQRLSVDNKRLSASETDLNDSLASANRLISALQNEMKSRNDRVIQLEVANRKLREQNLADAGKLSQLGQFSTELQELQRRRETLLSAILRRYRDVTDQYRALTAALENRSHEGAALPGADLSRIQNAIALAEDDLRQLNTLNAQAVRLEKKLAARQP
jgi:DNA repair exonuclease SbcCD ATPase subunit